MRDISFDHETPQTFEHFATGTAQLGFITSISNSTCITIVVGVAQGGRGGHLRLFSPTALNVASARWVSPPTLPLFISHPTSYWLAFLLFLCVVLLSFKLLV